MFFFFGMAQPLSAISFCCFWVAFAIISFKFLNYSWLDQRLRLFWDLLVLLSLKAGGTLLLAYFHIFSRIWMSKQLNCRSAANQFSKVISSQKLWKEKNKQTIEEFTLEVASRVIRARWREIQRFVLELKASLFFLNSYI